MVVLLQSGFGVFNIVEQSVPISFIEMQVEFVVESAGDKFADGAPSTCSKGFLQKLAHGLNSIWQLLSLD